MAHFDTTTLSLIALGETPTAEEAVHLVTCDTCRHEWESLRALVVTARDVDEHDLVAPPAHVWGAISAEISADSTNVVPLRARRSALPWVAVAAAMGLVLGGIGGVVAMQSSQTSPVLVATAPLEPLVGYDASGTARVESLDGGDVLAVDVRGLPTTDGYFEVWLLAPDASSMIAIGTLGVGDTGVFPLPPGVSLTDYPIVDISDEAYDGDPTHSTDSVVRGTLPA